MVGVAEGDTITVLTLVKEQVKIRLHGIDAPDKTLALRDESLRFQHLQQVRLLRDWRAASGDLPHELIFSISAVASGLRTTG